MNPRTTRHLIGNLRRHYNLTGEDILACYDTATQALFGGEDPKYVTVSVSPTNFKRLCKQHLPNALVKHPGSNVMALKLFDLLYVRSETRIPDAEVEWAKSIGCYTKTKACLIREQEAVKMAKSSTKKQIEHAVRILTYIEMLSLR